MTPPPGINPLHARTPDTILEDVEFMLSVGEHPARVAARLGRTPHAIEQVARRAGRHDIAAHFYAERERGRR